jgi:hypothetical protein
LAGASEAVINEDDLHGSLLRIGEGLGMRLTKGLMPAFRRLLIFWRLSQKNISRQDAKNAKKTQIDIQQIGFAPLRE